MNMTLNSNTNNNSTEDYKRRISLIQVEVMADALCVRLNNPDFKEWYCKVIHTLGADRVEELLGRVEDSKYAGKLFSRLANEEMAIKKANERLNDLKKK
jgi:hypothetical protein